MRKNNFLHEKKYLFSWKEIFFFMKRIWKHPHLDADEILMKKGKNALFYPFGWHFQWQKRAFFPTVGITEEEKRVQGRTEYMKQILPAVPPRQVFTTWFQSVYSFHAALSYQFPYSFYPLTTSNWTWELSYFPSLCCDKHSLCGGSHSAPYHAV